MNDDASSPRQPSDDPRPRTRLGVAKGQFEVPDFDKPLPPQVQASFAGEPFTPASDRESRSQAIARAEASVRLSDSLVPPEITEVNRRFVDGEISAEEHLVVVLRLAAAFARTADDSRRPGRDSVLGSAGGDAMVRAVRDVCEGRDAQPQARSPDFAIPEQLQELAVSVFGPEEGSRWWAEPAFGLGWQRPLDVLAQPGGTEIVEGLLRRIEAYVYT